MSEDGTSQATSHPVVAVFNTSDDLIEAMRLGLELEGYRVVTGNLRRDDPVRIVREHDPAVILYDVALPYEREWEHLQQLRRKPELRDRTFILMTTNAQRVKDLAGDDARVAAVVEKPQALDAIFEALRDAVRSRI